jgi:hypothetical protein
MSDASSGENSSGQTARTTYSYILDPRYRWPEVILRERGIDERGTSEHYLVLDRASNLFVQAAQDEIQRLNGKLARE